MITGLAEILALGEVQESGHSAAAGLRKTSPFGGCRMVFVSRLKTKIQSTPGRGTGGSDFPASPESPVDVLWH